MQDEKVSVEEIEELVIVRSEPHIYAFRTNTIPSYIKVGDTSQPIEERLKQWKKYFADLIRVFPSKENEDGALAKVSKDVYFRDYSVHSYFETLAPDSRLTKGQLKKIADGNLYYSNEFFTNISEKNVEEAIEDIKEDYKAKTGRYRFYRLDNKNAIDVEWNNDKNWKLRDNQKEVVKCFCEKVKTDNEFLMHAVMRFGKSFTSIYCAKEMGYSKVLVVSAKAEVAGEWKKTVQAPICFSEYKFIYDRHFKEDKTIIKKTLASTDGKNKVVVFLTLQNLRGNDSNGNDIKERLEDVFDTEFDLLIIDETHFGVWDTKYGERISRDDDEICLASQQNEFEDYLAKSRLLKAKVKLHLSGTPYNILFQERFNKNNIISSCQFSDILESKEKWDVDHRQDIISGSINPETNEPFQEYDNPYFGFPKMLKFAFNLPEKTRKTLFNFKDNGCWTLNDLFDVEKPRKNVKFIHEEDVLNLLRIIDGSQTDDSILSFLDLPKIKENEVCKHIVFVLPYKKSCDAMFNLLNKNKRLFKNLVNKKVEIINIAGFKSKFKEARYVDSVKKAIKDCEKRGKKTISLTVNKMLTGVTVEEWDTMIMLKNTKSPQEYDQAVFRMQNQYVKEYVDNDGRRYKIDMKPQTILVDFDPIRMFELQGLSTRTIDFIKEEPCRFDETLKRELAFFPIITSNGKNIVKVEPTNIVQIISNYNKEKSILDVSKNAFFDESIVEIQPLVDYIKTQSPENLSSSLSHPRFEGNDESKFDGSEQEEQQDGGSKHGNQKGTSSADSSPIKPEISDLKQRYSMCVAKLLFFAFLTDSKVFTLNDVLKCLDDQNLKSENNRIFNNLKLDKDFIGSLIEKGSKKMILDINEKISAANLLSEDNDFPDELSKVRNALNRLSKVSKSEVVNPKYICNKAYDLIGERNLIDLINSGAKILDVASKTGEFAACLYERMVGKVDEQKLKNCFYSICTSTTTYEFTRKIYEKLGMPTQNIANPQNINSYNIVDFDPDKLKLILNQNIPFDLISLDDAISENGDGKMIRFNAVVGNPPYQVGRKTIFHSFQMMADKMGVNYSCLIYPGKRWMHKSGKGVESFGQNLLEDTHVSEILFYPDANDIFPDVGVDDGISVVLKDYLATNNEFDYSYITVDSGIENTKSQKRKAPDKDTLFVLDPDDTAIADKIVKYVKEHRLKYLHDSVTEQKFFGIESNYIESNKSGLIEYKKGTEIGDGQVKALINDDGGPGGRATWFISDIGIVTKNRQSINKWKVVVSSAHPGGQNNRSNQLEILDKKSVFGRSRVALKLFDTKEEALNFYKYANSNFVKYALLLSDEALTSFAKLVPDFSNYKSDNGLIDFSRDVDEQLDSILGIGSNRTRINSVLKQNGK